MDTIAGILLMVFTYYAISVFLYFGIQRGHLELIVVSKRDGKTLDKNTLEYRIIKLAYCVCWIFPALQMLGRRLFGGKGN